MEETSGEFVFSPIDSPYWESVKEVEELEERVIIGELMHELRGLERTDRARQDSYNDSYTTQPNAISPEMCNLSRHYESSIRFTW